MPFDSSFISWSLWFIFINGSWKDVLKQRWPFISRVAKSTKFKCTMIELLSCNSSGKQMKILVAFCKFQISLIISYEYLPHGEVRVLVKCGKSMVMVCIHVIWRSLLVIYPLGSIEFLTHHLVFIITCNRGIVYFSICGVYLPKTFFGVIYLWCYYTNDIV